MELKPPESSSSGSGGGSGSFGNNGMFVYTPRPQWSEVARRLDELGPLHDVLDDPPSSGTTTGPDFRLDPADEELFGHNPLTDKIKLVRCVHCHRAVMENAFLRHLDMCIGGSNGDLKRRKETDDHSRPSKRSKHMLSNGLGSPTAPIAPTPLVNLGDINFDDPNALTSSLLSFSSSPELSVESKTKECKPEILIPRPGPGGLRSGSAEDLHLKKKKKALRNLFFSKTPVPSDCIPKNAKLDCPTFLPSEVAKPDQFGLHDLSQYYQIPPRKTRTTMSASGRPAARIPQNMLNKHPHYQMIAQPNASMIGQTNAALLSRPSSSALLSSSSTPRPTPTVTPLSNLSLATPPLQHSSRHPQSASPYPPPQQQQQRLSQLQTQQQYQQQQHQRVQMQQLQQQRNAQQLRHQQQQQRTAQLQRNAQIQAAQQTSGRPLLPRTQHPQLSQAQLGGGVRHRDQAISPMGNAYSPVDVQKTSLQKNTLLLHRERSSKEAMRQMRSRPNKRQITPLRTPTAVQQTMNKKLVPQLQPVMRYPPVNSNQFRPSSLPSSTASSPSTLHRPTRGVPQAPIQDLTKNTYAPPRTNGINMPPSLPGIGHAASSYASNVMGMPPNTQTFSRMLPPSPRHATSPMTHQTVVRASHLQAMHSGRPSTSHHPTGTLRNPLSLDTTTVQQRARSQHLPNGGIVRNPQRGVMQVPPIGASPRKTVPQYFNPVNMNTLGKQRRQLQQRPPPHHGGYIPPHLGIPAQPMLGTQPMQHTQPSLTSTDAMQSMQQQQQQLMNQLPPDHSQYMQATTPRMTQNWPPLNLPPNTQVNSPAMRNLSHLKSPQGN